MSCTSAEAIVSSLISRYYNIVRSFASKNKDYGNETVDKSRGGLIKPFYDSEFYFV